MEATMLEHEVQLSIDDYISALSGSGARLRKGSNGTFWVQYERWAMMRMPMFVTSPPESNEVRTLFMRGLAGVVSYILEPCERHPANAWLYICTDHEYDMVKLSPNMRRNVRRGLSELRISPVSVDMLLSHGTQAYCDTRRRVGLSDGTRENFNKTFSKCPWRLYLGAWRDETLVAFLSITEVEDWVELGCFSMDSFLNLRPNDTLIYSALRHYLFEKRCNLVSFGLSSIQAESNEKGLHAFKTKVGFEAKPVHRRFVVHPLLRPLASRLTVWAVSKALHMQPDNRLLKKADGVLRRISPGKD